MIQGKTKPKINDLERKITALEEEVRNMNYITKTAVLSLIKQFREQVIIYEPAEEIEIYEFMK